jgi:dTDP-4-dehydrorhamnose 3,5-epimerase
MKGIRTPIPVVLIFEPKVFGDERGFSLESWNARSFCNAVGGDICFVQDNHSRSRRGVLRGLHYQIRQPQGKLVRVASGVSSTLPSICENPRPLSAAGPAPS